MLALLDIAPGTVDQPVQDSTNPPSELSDAAQPQNSFVLAVGSLAGAIVELVNGNHLEGIQTMGEAAIFYILARGGSKARQGSVEFYVLWIVAMLLVIVTFGRFLT